VKVVSLKNIVLVCFIFGQAPARSGATLPAVGPTDRLIRLAQQYSSVFSAGEFISMELNQYTHIYICIYEAWSEIG
jgi:hypothetical protein